MSLGRACTLQFTADPTTLFCLTPALYSFILLAFSLRTSDSVSPGSISFSLAELFQIGSRLAVCLRGDLFDFMFNP